MKDLIFITGNQHKADYLAKWLGRPVPHQKIHLEEIQSLEANIVLADKARRAYEIIKKPVLVDDVTLTFAALGRLPGPLIKWFLEELGTAGLCDLAARLKDQHAVSAMTYALYDGKTLHRFHGETPGRIAPKPCGKSFGWNSIFIPDGFSQTYAEMTEAEFNACSHRGKAIEKLRRYLA